MYWYLFVILCWPVRFRSGLLQRLHYQHFGSYRRYTCLVLFFWTLQLTHLSVSLFISLFGLKGWRAGRTLDLNRKQSTTWRKMLPLTAFQREGLPYIGSVKDSIACSIPSDTSTRTVAGRRDPDSFSVWEWHDVAALIGACGNHAVASEWSVKTVPPPTRRIVQAVSRSFQTRSDMRRISGFWW